MSDSSESESEEKLNDNQEPIEEEAETSKTFKELVYTSFILIEHS